MELRDLVECIAKAMVEAPDQIEVRAQELTNSIALELRTGPNDMGRVIGKSGRVANAMRTLVQAAATRQGKRVKLEIVECAPMTSALSNP